MESTEKMRMLYLISGRSAASWNIGRKIPEVTKAFNKHITTDLLCGGDINGGIGYNNPTESTISPSDYHHKWYRQNSFFNFFTHSVSELKDLWHCFKTYKLLKKSDKHYSIIWERSTRLHWAGLLYARHRHLPYVLEWKDNLITYRFSLLHPLATYMERWKNKHADFITVESQVLKDMLIKENIDGSKIYVTYNAVNPVEFSKDKEAGLLRRKEVGLTEQDVVIGYVGTYAFYHDSEQLIKAAKIIKDRGYSHVKWLLIGDGKDKEKCEKMGKELGLLGTTIFMLPFQKKEVIPSFLSAIDITILPGSTDIICPIKVMEYMAAESVVMVPDYACNREIINSKNGLLFEPHNTKSIADAIEKVCSSKKNCYALGKQAKVDVIDNLTWDKTYGKVLEMILSKCEKNNYGKATD